MAIALTNIAHNQNGTGATIAVTVPVGGVPTGAVIFGALSERTNHAAPVGSVADTALNTYQIPTNASGNLNNVAANGVGELWYSYTGGALVSGNTITYTRNTSGSNVAFSCFYATGLLASGDPFDIAANATGTNTTPSVSVTPGTANDLAVGVLAAKGDAGTFTQDASLAWATPPVQSTTGSAGTAARVEGGTVVLSGASSTTYAPTISVGTPWVIIIATFKPAGGASRPVKMAGEWGGYAGESGGFVS